MEVSVDINAPADRVWAELIDVEHWPESTVSMTSVQRLDAGAFGVGSRARIKQPKLPSLVWTVTAFEPGKEFVWESISGTVRAIAGHRLDAQPDGSVRLTLSIRQTGLFSGFVARVYAGLTQRYLNLESAGLKRRCEQATAAAA
jgi:uncharacterized membrane protein